MFAGLQKRVSKTFSRAGEMLSGGPSPAKQFRNAIIEGDEDKAIRLYECGNDRPQQESGGDTGGSSSGSAKKAAGKSKAALSKELPPSKPFPSKKQQPTETPLHLASKFARLKLVELLLRHGGDPNQGNHNRESCLHAVCKLPDEPGLRRQILELIVNWQGVTEQGTVMEKVSVNSADNDGNTAIHHASANGLVSCVEQLVLLGAIISIVNKGNLTCCELADSNGYTHLATMLELALVFQPVDESMEAFSMEISFPYDGKAGKLVLDCTSLTNAGLVNYIEDAVRAVALALCRVDQDALLQLEDTASSTTSSNKYKNSSEGAISEDMENTQRSRAEALLNAFNWDVGMLILKYCTSDWSGRMKILADAGLATGGLVEVVEKEDDDEEEDEDEDDKQGKRNLDVVQKAVKKASTVTAAKDATIPVLPPAPPPVMVSTVTATEEDLQSLTQEEPSISVSVSEPTGKTPTVDIDIDCAPFAALTNPPITDPAVAAAADSSDESAAEDTTPTTPSALPTDEVEATAAGKQALDNLGDDDTLHTTAAAAAAITSVALSSTTTKAATAKTVAETPRKGTDPTVVEAIKDMSPAARLARKQEREAKRQRKAARRAAKSAGTGTGSGSGAGEKSPEKRNTGGELTRRSSNINKSPYKASAATKVVPSVSPSSRGTPTDTNSSSPPPPPPPQLAPHSAAAAAGTGTVSSASSAVSNDKSNRNKEKKTAKSVLKAAEPSRWRQLQMRSAHEPAVQTDCKDVTTISTGGASGGECAICGTEMLLPVPVLCFTKDQVAEPERREVLCMQDHSFCLSCWQGHIKVQVVDNGLGHLPCPAYKCGERLDVQWAPILLGTQEAVGSFLQQRQRHVQAVCGLKSCPVPGCGLMVHVPEEQRLQSSSSSTIRNIPSSSGSSSSSQPQTQLPITQTALCANGHSFCLSCSQESHTPLSCVDRARWYQTVEEEIKESGLKPPKAANAVDTTEDGGGEKGASGDALANALWVAANTKPCPRCGVHIEKDEGCNHMRCRKCRKEFCWLCQQDWSLHSDATGGWFQCNRYIESQTQQASSSKAGEGLDDFDPYALERGSAQFETHRLRHRNTTMARFIHHYSRWQAHGESSAMERRMQKETVLRIGKGLRQCLPKDSACSPLSSVSNAKLSGEVQLVWLQAHFAAHPLLIPEEEEKTVDGAADGGGGDGGGGDGAIVTLPGKEGGAASGTADISDKQVDLMPPAAATAESISTSALFKKHAIVCAEACLSFLTDGFAELLKCRAFLQWSYPYCYFLLDDNDPLAYLNKKPSQIAAQAASAWQKKLNSQGKVLLERHRHVFTVLQGDLEAMVETLSDVVARRRLRATKAQIVLATRSAKSKRLEAEMCVISFVNHTLQSSSSSNTVTEVRDDSNLDLGRTTWGTPTSRRSRAITHRQQQQQGPHTAPQPTTQNSLRRQRERQVTAALNAIQDDGESDEEIDLINLLFEMEIAEAAAASVGDTTWGAGGVGAPGTGRNPAQLLQQMLMLSMSAVAPQAAAPPTPPRPSTQPSGSSSNGGAWRGGAVAVSSGQSSTGNRRRTRSSASSGASDVAGGDGADPNEGGGDSNNALGRDNEQFDNGHSDDDSDDGLYDSVDEHMAAMTMRDREGNDNDNDHDSAEAGRVVQSPGRSNSSSGIGGGEGATAEIHRTGTEDPIFGTTAASAGTSTPSAATASPAPTSSSRMNVSRAQRLAAQAEEETMLNYAILRSLQDPVAPAADEGGAAAGGGEDGTGSRAGTTFTGQSEQDISILESMGFNREQAIQALRENRNDVQVAANRLLGL